jgi:predicted glycosyltransferase
LGERSLRNRYFDAILVHADPRFARLEESFHPGAALRIPIHYTGFVLSDAPADRTMAPVLGRQVVVSAGGGLVGEPLLRAAVDAHALLWRTEGLRMKVIAGPFLPGPAWQALRAAARGRAGLQVRRSVPDLTSELRTSAASVSQCGYNTALELVQTRVPALVVPYGDGMEDEQMRRARRLERLGALRVLDPRRLDGPALAAEIRALLDFRPQAVDLDLAGARNTAQLVRAMAGALGAEEQAELAQEVSR